MEILNITNGDCAAEVLKKAQVEGHFLPWRDVLHEGPVPGGLTLRELSEVRARFIAQRGWAPFHKVMEDFQTRDLLMEKLDSCEKIVLWFEHDLYDQLQLLQILSWTATELSRKDSLYIVLTDTYLGTATRDEVILMSENLMKVTLEQFETAQRAWDAFTDSSPVQWFQLLSENTRCLPYLRGTILRILQEYPCSKTGLSRTERAILEVVSQGPLDFSSVFQTYQQTEEYRFLGDVQCKDILERLADSAESMIRIVHSGSDRNIQYEISHSGKMILSRRATIHWNSFAERWIGGVKLSPDNMWLWDNTSQSVLKKEWP